MVLGGSVGRGGGSAGTGECWFSWGAVLVWWGGSVCWGEGGCTRPADFWRVHQQSRGQKSSVGEDMSRDWREN